ncbi:alpha/beta hydrolase [Candidatus Mycobacterium wuenschmannii]|uniref:Alpha/beta hydrolase n=1 Tax=Candidatus Mycobacterium wuenschmannii TaxID=3027808 RepID=A0ABY8VUP6_9MYCO|nr:alpha/beta hydrolase [Candidatus Mycobacterium wuenschmannii]WIM86771.1 alpha/beta hydrolase [Candidatus Mycobacterium wuenschmannii]
MTVEEFVYAHRATGPLKLRVFRPAGSARRSTAVLHLHGGAWRAGTPEMLDARSAALAAHGYTVVQAQYRLLGQAGWPAPITDVRSALRWVAAHADQLGVRPDALVLWGHSAGGHIALTTAATRADGSLDDGDDDTAVPISVAAVIDCYAPVSFRAEDPPALRMGPAGIDLAAILAGQRTDGAIPAADLLGEPCTEAEADAVSPLALVDAAFPPTMIVHGTADILIQPINSRRLADELTRLGVVNELVTFAECNHEFDASPSYATAVTAHVDIFLRRVLNEPGLAAEVAAYSMFR